MNKKLLSIIVLILMFAFSSTAFASLTFTTNAITGTTASTIDLGSGNALSLQTTNNGAITTGTGMVTLGGSLTLPVTTSSTSGIIFVGTSPFIHDFALAGTIGQNTFLGVNAGNFTMTGSTGLQGSNNVGIGFSALTANTTGLSNTAVGVGSLASNTVGQSNAAFGASSLYSNTTGVQNTGIGSISLYNLTTGNVNTGIGSASMFALTTGSFNAGLGLRSLGLATTGSNNTAVGSYAGYQSGSSPSTANAVTTGGNNTFLGYESGLGSATQRTNSTTVGALAYVDADNTVVLGNAAVTDVLAGSTSGARVHGLSLMSTRGVPASSSDTCVAGESWDAVDTGTAYHYFCSATNTIVRVVMATW